MADCNNQLWKTVLLLRTRHCSGNNLTVELECFNEILLTWFDDRQIYSHIRNHCNTIGTIYVNITRCGEGANNNCFHNFGRLPRKESNPLRRRTNTVPDIRDEMHLISVAYRSTFPWLAEDSGRYRHHCKHDAGKSNGSLSCQGPSFRSGLFSAVISSISLDP